MNHSIVGRDQEIELLKELYDSHEPEFLAVYGRRRIGKTYLISEFFKDKGVYFEITGIKKGSMKEQLFQFAYAYSRVFNQGNRIETPKNWGEALTLLHEAVESCSRGKKVILFFDEVPWLATRRSKLLNALEHAWNRYLSRNKQVILIICGSSASWIIKNIINNRGGLHGRVTRKMRLLPFSLSETEQYLLSRQIELDRKQIIDLYIAIGGVPKYLSYVKKGKSAAQNINDLCFSLNGGLYGEFDNLYRSLFDKYEEHISIVKALAKNIEGLTKDELLKEVKLTSGGSSSKIIEELVDAGFLIYVPSFQKKTRGIYRLIDEYSLFYLNWVHGVTNMGLESIDDRYWINKFETPKWRAWSGCAFESLCYKHIQKIKNKLGISGMSTIESGWRVQNAQIDLIIDRADKCINLCEMKYSDDEFVIDKEYLEKLNRKKRIFKDQTKTRKTLFTTLVTTHGVKKNGHYNSIVDQQLTMNDLF
jgi:uncharacterized protein